MSALLEALMPRTGPISVVNPSLSENTALLSASKSIRPSACFCSAHASITCASLTARQAIASIPADLNLS